MEKLFQQGLNLSLPYLLVYLVILLFVYMTGWFCIALSKKRADFADVAWGMGFSLVAWTSMFLGHVTFYGTIVNILVTLWALRLMCHIYLRNRNVEEDFRYQALKKQWGDNFKSSLYTQVFLLQGSILLIVSLPIVWIHTHPESLNTTVLFSIIPLWICAFIIETLADHQLVEFKKAPFNTGKLLRSGLWSYVRHPNYLGELLQWWAIWLMAAYLPFGWLFVLSPLLLSFLIIYVSGIKPLEEKMHKHPDFSDYAAKTPKLIPFLY